MATGEKHIDKNITSVGLGWTEAGRVLLGGISGFPFSAFPISKPPHAVELKIIFPLMFNYITVPEAVKNELNEGQDPMSLGKFIW